MLIIVVGIFYVGIAYRKAKQRGHNSIRWAVIAAAVFLGTQILVSGGIGFVLGLGEGLWGWSEGLFEAHQIHITIISLLACAFTNWLALRPLSKVSGEPIINEPPPPPTFR